MIIKLSTPGDCARLDLELTADHARDLLNSLARELSRNPEYLSVTVFAQKVQIE